MTASNILLVGCGNLGRAMLAAWLKHDLELHFTLLEPQPSLELLDIVEPHGTRIAINPTSAFKIDVAVLAVKPQVMDEALKTLGHALPHTSLVISVAAGKRIATLKQFLHTDQPIVRAMPNIAAGVGEAMTALTANAHVSKQHREIADTLFNTIGQTIWVDDESQFDALGSLIGCGPAFFFLLAECLAKAGVAEGLPEKIAVQIARQVLAGSGALLQPESAAVADLRRTVTSPGGMTEAALKVLMGENGLQKLLNEAVKTATERSKQLAD